MPPTNMGRSLGATGPSLGPAEMGQGLAGGSVGVSMGADQMSQAPEQADVTPRVDRARLRGDTVDDSSDQVTRETADIEFGSSRVFKFYVLTQRARNWLWKAFDSQWFTWSMLVAIVYECGLAVFTKEDPYFRLGAAAFAMLFMAMFFKYTMFMEKHKQITETARERIQERTRHDEQVMRPLAEMLQMRRADNRENRQFWERTNTTLSAVSNTVIELQRRDQGRAVPDPGGVTAPGVHRARLQQNLADGGVTPEVPQPNISVGDISAAVERVMDSSFRTHLLRAIRPAVNAGLGGPVTPGEHPIVSVGFLNWAADYIQAGDQSEARPSAALRRARSDQGADALEGMVRIVERDPRVVPPPQGESAERPIRRSEGMDGMDGNA